MPDPPTQPAIPDELRADYARGALVESDLSPDPIAQFRKWFQDAIAAKLPEPNAMTLATVDVLGKPSARMVLLKGFDARGFTLFTNYGSRKARQLDANPCAALVIYWQPLERQVRIEGTVGKLGRDESQKYFDTRPLAARIGAWASPQSEVILSREELDRRFAEMSARFGDGNVPLPENWGGYVVRPEMIEFWQGRPGRLHDRLVYTRQSDHTWKIQRLAP
ncbi:MAG: pyridoxamine 5'-phosphate oxidase [Tepidisphaeraceae bacterium]